MMLGRCGTGATVASSSACAARSTAPVGSRPAMPGPDWYTALREAHRPDAFRLLLIGESAPDPGDSKRRFFYAPTLTPADNLFRGVVLAPFGHQFSRGSAGASKQPWLDE